MDHLLTSIGLPSDYSDRKGWVFLSHPTQMVTYNILGLVVTWFLLGYCELPVSFSWGNVCILVVVEGYLSMCYQ